MGCIHALSSVSIVYCVCARVCVCVLYCVVWCVHACVCVCGFAKATRYVS